MEQRKWYFLNQIKPINSTIGPNLRGDGIRKAAKEAEFSSSFFSNLQITDVKNNQRLRRTTDPKNST